jgi:hypothetical protein
MTRISFEQIVVCFNTFSHFLPYYNTPTFVFPSLVDDMSIVGVVSDVVPAFVQLEAKFVALGFSIQLAMHNLVSIRIRFIHIISFKSSYI